MPRIRVAEVFGALSLTTDLASGVPVEKGLRTCVLATAFAPGIHREVLIMSSRGVGTRKGVPDLGEYGLPRSA